MRPWVREFTVASATSFLANRQSFSLGDDRVGSHHRSGRVKVKVEPRPTSAFHVAGASSPPILKLFCPQQEANGESP